MSFEASLKGWIGESIGSLSQAMFLDKKDYATFNNLTLPTRNGTTQIDHVIVSRFGIFVVEDKTVAGWIFGDPNEPNWTISNWGRKYRIQNPIHQNYRHVSAVADTVEIDKEHIHSIVVFRGKCEFKTSMPDNVLTTGYTDYIKSFKKVVFSPERTKELSTSLVESSKEKSWQTSREHVDSLRERYSSTRVCPKCGGGLVLRTARTASNSGGQFYGCSNYPRCKYIKNV